ncbi:thiosulfate oxidation carrier protein SoxY [Sulfurovum sp. zt1-1]|uniref:Thiosulfate oxidation carrier protein SoxY n=1 Tax=Sulfurovum zhangzhouensis TaxID=3019067 RepID=A0ABT7R020_9BACT|nr:thiosulfate oxidation carrier protein SoxY [Sulfurovum zhangzhouensis]MDM5272447.1 thiosulfate oxidation carrier protein SoxY [Sulfurovum zhangzhouensis]
MERRKFLGLGLTAAAVLPVALSAKDFRQEKPDVWTAHKVEPAIEALYGKITPIEEGIKIQLPKVASNGGAVPVKFKSDIPAKTVALFQDANPESAVAVFDEPSVIDFYINIKMKASGTITVVVEGKDGKFYIGKQSLEVALGGCEG